MKDEDKKKLKKTLGLKKPGRKNGEKLKENVKNGKERAKDSEDVALKVIEHSFFSLN